MGTINFYEKNKIDLDVEGVTITITDATATDDGDDSKDRIRNRRNDSGWATTGSNDAANTQIDVETANEIDIDNIFLIDMNWDSYTIQYWNGAAFVDFSTAINESSNTATTKNHTFDKVTTDQIRIIITAAMTTDDDKFLSQLILTESIGTLSDDARFRAAITKNRNLLSGISGKANIVRNVGAYEASIQRIAVTDDTTMTVIENLFNQVEGFLIWPCGGDTTKFSTVREGFRLQDIFLVGCANEYEPLWHRDYFDYGNDVDLKLVEIM